MPGGEIISSNQRRLAKGVDARHASPLLFLQRTSHNKIFLNIPTNHERLFPYLSKLPLAIESIRPVVNLPATQPDGGIPSLTCYLQTCLHQRGTHPVPPPFFQGIEPDEFYGQPINCQNLLKKQACLCVGAQTRSLRARQVVGPSIQFDYFVNGRGVQVLLMHLISLPGLRTM